MFCILSKSDMVDVTTLKDQPLGNGGEEVKMGAALKWSLIEWNKQKHPGKLWNTIVKQIWNILKTPKKHTKETNRIL